MKFVRFNGGKTGLVIDRNGLHIADIGTNLPAFGSIHPAHAAAIGEVLGTQGAASWVPMIGRWDDLRGAFAAFEDAAGGSARFVLLPYDEVSLEPPLASPTIHIFGAGSNTIEHVQRAFKIMKNQDLSVDDVLAAKRGGKPPPGFTIWPDTVVGHGATITPPHGFTKIDYEAECAAVVQSAGPDSAPIRIWGYAGWNDLGVRDPHLGLSPESDWIPFSFNLPKNFDTGNACGPWVAVDEGDFANARCKTFVNGEQRQDWALSNMIYSFEDIFAFIATYQKLRPGDIVTSGTGPGVAIDGGVDGNQWLMPGDVIDVVVDGAGTLTNRMGQWVH